MKKENLLVLARYAALTGNLFFILWVTANAAKSGFKGTFYEQLSYIILMGLLILNIFLLLTQAAKKREITN